ncbi:MAG: cation-translocating P-type ATPase, partial [Cupriavidus sp.]|nr:cation-translocating P-type ATPase [Cupriavidus sp.]
ALAAAGAALSRRGVLLARGHALETLARVTDVVLDKTGTLTEGRFAVAAVEPLGEADSARCLALAAAMERGGEHPIARALVAAAPAPAGQPLQVGDMRNVPGHGLEAEVAGRRLRLGRADFVFALGGAAQPAPAAADSLVHPGATVVWLGAETGPLARFVLADVERKETPMLLARLHELGVRCHLVSGDNMAAVHWWAARFGIERMAGEVTPEGKRDYVARLQQDGAVVLAVGDGINDAPVLAQAQVSIAIGSGAPLAQAGADAVLTHGGVAEIATALAVSRQTRRVVRQNLGWAFFYNVVAIPLAATGLVTAWMAGIGMSLSSLLVVANAWRLLRAGTPRHKGA